VLTWLLAVGVFMLVAQLACDVLFGIDIGAGRVVATVVLCVLLGAWHAGVGCRADRGLDRTARPRPWGGDDVGRGRVRGGSRCSR
jgi:hypothetical protein